MYITNPTEDMLSEFFACDWSMADVLIMKYKLNVIYVSGGVCYFKNTEALEEALKQMKGGEEEL